MQASNFSFLNEKWEILYNLGKMAEQSLYVDAHNTLVKLRLLSETIVEYILAMKILKYPLVLLKRIKLYTYLGKKLSMKKYLIYWIPSVNREIKLLTKQDTVL